MKKVLLLLTIMVTLCTYGWAQLGVGQQLQNNDFESWSNESGTSTLAPNNWHTMNAATGGLSGSASSSAFVTRVSGNHAGGSNNYYVQLKSVSKVGVTANGSITTGCFNAGSMTPENTKNCAYTSASGFHQSFSSYPDSVYVWTKTDLNSSSHEAQFNIVLHNGSAASGASHGAIYQDPTPTATSGLFGGSEQDNSVVNTTSAVNEAKAVAKAKLAFNTNESWVLQKKAFTYTNNSSAPTYVLATFSTNKNAGSGKAGDLLYIDDIVFIYNTRLATLKVNGNDLAGFNPDVTDYNYPTPISCTGDAPTVTGTCQSAHASTEIMHNSTSAEPYTTIRVKHLNQETTVYKDYTIHFTYETITVTLNNGGSYTACAGESITMTASGANSYQWSNNLGNTATVHPTESGQYTVTGTTGNCSASATAYVTVKPLPNVTINGSTSGTASICSGNSVTLTASGATSFVWNYNSSTATSINVNTSGTYTVVGTSNDCSASASVTVTAHDAPTVTINGPNSICSGTTATLTASGLANYTWSGTATGEGASLNITTGGTYTVSGTDANGCSGSANHSVTGKTTPTVTITGPTLLCQGATGTLTATANPTCPITWTGGTAGNNNLTINAAGTYTATANLDGCEGSASTTVATSASPAEPTTTSDSRCGAGSLTLSAHGEDGTTLYWYASENASSSLYNGESFNIPNLNTTTTYYVSARNEAGCYSDRVAVTATINTPPAAPTVTTPNINICGEGDVTLTATSDNPNNSVVWYSSQVGEQTVDAEQHITQTTTFYAAAFDGTCYSSRTSLTVTKNDIPAAPSVVSPDPFCSNSSVTVQLTATPASGCIVKWYSGNMQSIGQGSPMKSVSSDTTFYATSYNNSSKCESSPVAFNIDINPVPAAPTLSCEPRCGAGEITLSANGQSVKWYTANEQYLGEGANYSTTIAPGNTVFKAKVTSLGCESSLASVTAVAHNTYSGIIDNKTACGSYFWEGTTYDESGDYLDTLQTVNGCDSIVTLHLTINNGYNQSFDTTVCDQFVWQGQTYTSSGSDTKNLPSVSGCDSVVTYNFIVKQSTSSTQSLTLCSNQLPYPYADTTITSGGTKTITIPNAEGCDSVITLYVTVNPQPNLPTVSNKSLCGAGSTALTASSGTNGTTCRWYTSEDDETPFFTGTSRSDSYSENTTYYISSYNQNTQCESGRLPMTVTVNARPEAPQVTSVSNCGAGAVTMTATADENATTCRWYQNNNTTIASFTGYEYTRTVSAPSNNNTYTITVFVDSYNDSTQCASTTRTQAEITVNPVPAAPQTTPVTHCGTLTADLADYVTSASSLYRWYDSDEVLLSENAHFTPTVNESTTYLVSNYNSETMCESEKTPLTVTINSIYAPQNIYDTICQHSAYSDYGIQQMFENTGEFDFSLNTVSSAGCDSIVTLHIYVKPVITNTISATECDSYIWAGTTYNQSGSYQKTFTAANGCDSIVTLNLTIHNSVTTEFSAAQCDSYIWNNQTYTQSGNYTQTFTSSDNCDSTVTLHLTIYPSYQHDFEVSACEEFIWNNIPYQTSGDYTQSFETIHGCDSTVTMHLTIYEPVVLNLEDEICAGTPYTGYGFDTTFTQPNVYHLTHFGETVHTCDSTTNLVLTVHPIYNQNIQKMICENSSYTFNGQTLTEPGLYTAQLQTVHQCDSIVTLNLTIGSQFRDTITAHICAGESYNQHGFNIETPAVSLYDSLELQASNGCDSVSVLHLIVHYPDTAHLYETLCQDESYRQHGFNITLNEAGDTTLSRHTVTPFGCDSVIMVHITVNPKSTITLYDTVCAETTYELNGFEAYYEEAGNYTLVNHGQNQYLCDSTTTLQLTVLPTYHLTVNQTACESFTWNGETYEESGEYTQNLTSTHGCDSIVTMNLTILQPDTTTVTHTACGSYTWNNETYEESGSYTQTLQNIHQCDSVVILNLEIRPTSSSTFDTTVCVSFTWNDTTYYQSGSYVQHFENSLGCDSTVTLLLTVNPVDTVFISKTSCVSYTWNGQIYEETGDYTQSFTNVFNCDSIVTLHLTINQTIATEDHVSICDNELPYTYGDTVFEVGTPEYSVFNFHFSSVTGCDSIVTLYLTVNPTYSIDTIVNVCDVDLPYVWDNNDSYSYMVSGDYDIPFQTTSSCDSIIHLHLNVNPTYMQDTAVTVCQGALPYYFDDEHSFDLSGDFTVNLLTESGCDSIWHLHLTVTPNAEHVKDTTICDNELPYTFLGETFTEAGQYDIIDTADGNCLTITHLTLFVNPTFHVYDTVTVCEETLPYLYGTTLLNETGDFDIHFNAVTTCDSLISVHFTVIPTALGVDELYVCASDFPVTYGGQSFTQEGVYTVTFHREGLCDSLVTLTLLQAQEYLFPETDEVCDHVLPYVWRGQELTQSGIYFDSLTTQHGCDSIYRLTLTINETQLIVENPIVLCAGESETWHGMTLSESGIYRDTVNNVTTGCYEIHEVNVTVNPTYLFHDTVTVCSDELPYPWRDMSLTEAGIHEDYFQTVNFCDSIYRITLVVNPSYHVTENISVCDYDLPHIWHGQYLAESGIYYDTLVTDAGCDSTFMLTFTVNPTEHLTLIDTICDGELPYSWRDYYITATGTYFDTVPNSFGCNDIYELQLTVNQSNIITIYDTICQGGYYSQYGFDTIASQVGTLYDQLTLTNANGCDSTVNLILLVLPTYLIETEATTCENVPYSWHGGEYIAEGTYYDSLVTASGCDSVFVLHLTLNPTYDVFVSDSAINGHEYTYDNFVTTPSDSGTYHYDIQHYTIAGCDSIIHLTLYVAFNDGIENFTMTPQFDFYPNPTAAVLNIRGERIKHVTIYDLAGKRVSDTDPDSPESAKIDVTHFTTGHYVVKVLLDDGNYVSGKIIVNRK